MNNVPPIKASAQARLLLYKLIKGKLAKAEQRLLEADPELWPRILEMLEHELESGTSLGADQIALEQIFSHIARATREGLQRQMVALSGKPLWIGSHPTKLLEIFVTDHSRLIKSVQREQLDKINLGLKRGIREGRLLESMSKDIQQATGLSKRRARLIARDGALSFSGDLTRYHQKSAGIKQYRWQTSRDERVRKSHRERNGKVYDWDGPGPYPRNEVCCRCDAIPVLDL